VVDFLLVLIELCSPALIIEALRADIGQNFGVRNVWVTLRAISGGRGSFANDSWRQKTRVPGLSHGVCYLCDPMFSRLIQYWRVTQTHDDG